MATSKEKKNKVEEKSILPRPTGLLCQVMDVPIPGKDTYIEEWKVAIAQLGIGGCLYITVDDSKDIIHWQRNISSICYNYKVKIQDKDFTVRVVDEVTIGVWRKS